jgi:hypothetical protein
MSTCAVVEGNLVVNMIVAEPTDTPLGNCILVLVSPDLPVQIGYTYQDPYFYNTEGKVVTPYEAVVEPI